MKLMRNKYVLIIAMSVVAAMLLAINQQLFHVGNPGNNSDPLSDITSSNLDLNNDRVLVGAVDNIFVGRVVEQVNTEMLGILHDRPHTSFRVEVIYNVKGEVAGSVLVKQEGAYIDNKYSVIRPSDSADGDIEGDALALRPGHTYLLLVEQRGGVEPYFYLAYNLKSTEMLDNDSSMTTQQLIELARHNDRVYELLVAYVYEVPWRSTNNTNGFTTLSEEKKQAVFDKFGELIPPRPIPKVENSPSQIPQQLKENTWSLCRDGVDNDENGLIDNNDPSCALILRENNFSLCRDNLDNDNDGLSDAADPDCAQFYPQPEPIPEPITYPPTPSSTPVYEAPVSSSTPTSTGQ